MEMRVFFGTNRTPLGTARELRGFSSDAPNDSQNLRFGHVDLDVAISANLDPEAIETRAAKKGSIVDMKLYEEDVAKKKLGSSHLFKVLKARMMRGDHIIVYLHGYSETFGSAMATAAMMQAVLRPRCFVDEMPHKTHLVLFSWPSDGRKTPWKAYRDDRVDARNSGGAIGRGLLYFRDFLRDIQRGNRCSGRISLIAHSMGAYALQHGLRHILYLEASLPRLFNEVILLAPDVDSTVFEDVTKFGALPDLAERVTVYIHRGDRALELSDTTKGNPERLGQAGPRNMSLVSDRLDVVECSRVGTSFTRHHYYREPAVLRDIEAVLAGHDFATMEHGRVWLPARYRWMLSA